MEGPLEVMNLGVQLTLFRPVGADYAQDITPCPPGFENLTASLLSFQLLKKQPLSQNANFLLAGRSKNKDSWNIGPT